MYKYIPSTYSYYLSMYLVLLEYVLGMYSVHTTMVQWSVTSQYVPSAYQVHLQQTLCILGMAQYTTCYSTVPPCTALHQYILPCTTVHDPGDFFISIWYLVRLDLPSANAAQCQLSTYLFVLGITKHLQVYTKMYLDCTWSLLGTYWYIQGKNKKTNEHNVRN